MFSSPFLLLDPTPHPKRPSPSPHPIWSTTADDSCRRHTDCLGNRRTVRSVLRFSFACGLRPHAKLNPRTPLTPAFLAPQTHVKRTSNATQPHFKRNSKAPQTHRKRTSNASQTQLNCTSNAPQTHLKRTSNEKWKKILK